MNQARGSRRQKIYDLVKTTRDVYIPTISTTITQLASEATTRAINYTESNENLPNTDTEGANITLYPHFTRVSEDGKEYFTQVNGWVYSTSGSTRKKRLVLALARQLSRTNNTNAVADVTVDQLDEQISNIHQQNDAQSSYSTTSDQASSSDAAKTIDTTPTSPVKRQGTASSSSSTSTSSTNYNDIDDTLKERIASFVNRSLGNLELKITVGGSDRDDLKTVQILTDANGNFNIDVQTEFKPSYLRVAVYLDERIFAFKETIFPGESEYAIISDIDDTIKKTGVLEDKRSVFRTTFANHMSTWEIPGAADCYRYFRDMRQFSFFYISNSPYQLYSSLTEFIKIFEFPVGSIYLKKYSGNILNSIWEPSHTRKKAPLERVFSHFGNKKFFLIGDTSEQDLEAYVDITRSHPEQVCGIYLRVVKGSMTTETFKTLTEILAKRAGKDGSISQSSTFSGIIEPGSHLQDIARQSKEKSEQIVHNLIDLEEGNENDFFAHNIETSKGAESFTVKPTDTLTSDAPPTESKPTHKPHPPKVPKKPTFLKSDSTVKSTPESATSTSSSAPIGSPEPLDTDSDDIQLSKELSTPNTAPPSLPKRPSVPPLPPRSRVGDLNLESTPVSDEANDEWISRILTSLIVLRKVGNVNLKLFVDFSEVQEDIENKINNKI